MTNYQRQRKQLIKLKEAKFQDKVQTETFSYIPKSKKK